MKGERRLVSWWGLYILKDGNVTATRDVLKWAKWFERPENQRVAYDKVGNTEISTIFLGVDFTQRRRPVLWETVVFKKGRAIETLRYSSKREAEAGHIRLVRAAAAGDVAVLAARLEAAAKIIIDVQNELTLIREGAGGSAQADAVPAVRRRVRGSKSARGIFNSSE